MFPMQKNIPPILFISVALGIIVFVAGLYVGQQSVLQVRETNRLEGEESFPRSGIAIPEGINEEDIDFPLFFEVWQEVKKDYYAKTPTDKELFYGAIKGMVNAVGDPYTVFFDPEEAAEFNKALQGTFEGVGAELAIKHDVLTVVAPLAGSPAELAGILPGDKIFAIDGKDTFSMSLDAAVTKIRGPKGTAVTLTIVHKDEEEPMDIELVRDTIVVNTVSYEFIGEGKDIMYMRIFSFNDDTASDFERAAKKIVKEKPRALILDLRSNPGGYLDTAVFVASLWIENGVIVKEQFASPDDFRDYLAQGDALFDGLETVVLVNEGSASAAEIVAGALKDYAQAVVVGEKTFGKGSVQEYSAFEEGSALKITVAQWLTPKGTSLNKEGITPDIEVKMTSDDYNNDKDPQREKALELLQ